MRVDRVVAPTSIVRTVRMRGRCLGRVLALALAGGLVGHASGSCLVTTSVSSRNGCLMDVHPRGRYVVLHISVMKPGEAVSDARATMAA